jgi:ethanolamine ammonia-lyase small subunit
MITYHGGVNPLEAGAYVVELIQKTLKNQASGVELKQKLSGQSNQIKQKTNGAP